MDQLMLFASGNHRNVPKTVARRYQLKAHSEQPLDINAFSPIAKGDNVMVEMSLLLEHVRLLVS